MGSHGPQEIRSNGLPDVQRIITDHNNDGKAIISDAIPSNAVWQPIGKVADFFLGYTTRTFPVELGASSGDERVETIPKDVQNYKKDMESPPGLSISTGTVLRYVDMAPDAISPMHRTVSLDYGIVLEGVVELVLDSGETKIMRRGDSCIQRATNHAWRNVTPDGGWARMVYVLVSAEQQGDLKEDLGDMPSVRSSD